MNRFENMETFIKVVELGSITATASQFGIAKSAISRRIKELETHLGVELFHRTTRRLTLTDTGQVFYQQAVRIVEDLLAVEFSTSQAHAQLQGRLKIALPMSFSLMHLGPAIKDFLQQHPKIEFDLDFNDRQVDIIQEGFDLAIRVANLADSSLVARRLTTINHVVCASPEYLKQHGVPQTPEELISHKCLAYSLVDNYKNWHFVGADNREYKVPINPYIKASAGEYLREAAVNGQGIVLLPTFIVYQEIKQGSLILLLKEYTSPSVNAYAIYPKTHHLSQRVRIFVDFLVERFKEIPYWDLYE